MRVEQAKLNTFVHKAIGGDAKKNPEDSD